MKHPNPCLHCKRALRFDRERGWVHTCGGGAYWIKCRTCGWQGSGVEKCPNCNNIEGLRDDHCALPNMQNPIGLDEAMRDEARRLGWREGCRPAVGVSADV